LELQRLPYHTNNDFVEYARTARFLQKLISAYFRQAMSLTKKTKKPAWISGFQKFWRLIWRLKISAEAIVQLNA